MLQPSDIRKVAFLGDCLPRKCGIATFTTDLRCAVVAKFPAMQCLVVPVNDLVGGYDYPEEVRFKVAEQDQPSYPRAADLLNHNDSSKYSDISAFKGAMTGGARFSRSHRERLSASPAAWQSQVGVTLQIIGMDQAHCDGGKHRESGNFTSLGLVSARAETEHTVQLSQCRRVIRQTPNRMNSYGKVGCGNRDVK